MVVTILTLTMAVGVALPCISTDMPLTKITILYEGQPRVIILEEILKEFQREGNTLPDDVIKRHAIYDLAKWAALRKSVDEKSGYQYLHESFEVHTYGKIHHIAILINAPVETGLETALRYSQDNFGYGRKNIELSLEKEDGRKFKLKGTTGDILPNSLYKSLDSYGNEVYGYQLLLEQHLPKPVSSRKLVMRVFNHYLCVHGDLIVVSEWYQGQGEGEFKYLRGCYMPQKALPWQLSLRKPASPVRRHGRNCAPLASNVRKAVAGTSAVNLS